MGVAGVIPSGQYVAAAVNLSVAPGVSDKRAEEIRDALAGRIKNLALIE